MLAVWLLLLVLNALDYTAFSFLADLLEIAALTAIGGILLGSLLDYLALRKTELARLPRSAGPSALGPRLPTVGISRFNH
jgi:membrane associated rhomboid family serine protease